MIMLVGATEKLMSFGKITFALVGVASAVLLAILVDLRISSSLLRLWITSQLIVLVIWKFSDISSNSSTSSPYHYLEQLDYLPPRAADSPPEETDWYPAWSSPPSSPRDVDPPLATEEAVKREATAAAEAREDSTSMDDTWKAILEGGGGAGRRPVLTKCETWEGRGNAEAEAEAERAVAALRRSDTVVLLRNNDEEVEPAAAAAAAGKRRRRRKKKEEEEEVGWREREKLVVSQDELFQRVEMFIKKHHDHLRLQRQESEQRRLDRLGEVPSPILIPGSLN